MPNINDGFTPEQVIQISSLLNTILADLYALYIKTKNFHWHISGPHFRDWHLMLDEQATQIYNITDDVAERVRKIGGNTIKSIGQIADLQRIQDNDESSMEPVQMLEELFNDNQALVSTLRDAHAVCAEAKDFASTAMIEVWIDEAERRSWFLYETTH